MHSTKNSGLGFRNFRVSKGTVFFTGLNRSRQNGGFAVRLVFSLKYHFKEKDNFNPTEQQRDNNYLLVAPREEVNLSVVTDYF